MKTAITESKIQRLEKKYGKFLPEKSVNGWLTFEGALISSDESLVLKSEKAKEKILSHYPNKRIRLYTN